MRRFIWGRRCKAEIVMDERLAAVTVSGLVKDFPGVRAIDHLSFEVAHNEIFGIVGPDGAGKTTTMRILAGALAPYSGHATAARCDLARHPEALGWDEAKACTGMRADSHGAGAVARRADQRRRSGFAARILGDAVYAGGSGRDDRQLDGVPGRGRAMPSNRAVA